MIVEHGIPGMRRTRFHHVRIRLIVVVGRHSDAARIDDHRAARQRSRALQMSVTTGNDRKFGETSCSGGNLGTGRWTGPVGVDCVEEILLVVGGRSVYRQNSVNRCE